MGKYSKNKFINVKEAAKLIKDGARVWLSGGGGGINDPDKLLSAIEQSFLECGTPAHLTFYHSAGIGNKQGGGADHFAHEGMVDKVIGSHWTWSVNMQELVKREVIEAYVLPQGVMTQLIRETAAKRPGLFTKVGRHTFVDPEKEGGKLNQRSKEDLSVLAEIDGETYIHYKALPIDVAIFRGSEADEDGNVSFLDEGIVTEALSEAQAAKNNGGIVICQVKKRVKRGEIKPYQVIVPGVLIDAIVIDENQRMSQKTEHDDCLSGRKRGELVVHKHMPQNNRKLIAKRAAMEIPVGSVTNLGFGIPSGIGSVLNESGEENRIHLSLEQGIIGGVPETGSNFGIAYNPKAILCETNQFDWYDGGGLDVAVLSFAEFDRYGNVNVSKFNGCINGIGGFINISQNAKKVIFTGTFTAGGLEERCDNGVLEILKEGRFQKIRKEVEQISFSGRYATETGQKVIFITERAVFCLEEGEIVLKEIAPGIDMERDILSNMEFLPKFADSVKLMDSTLFYDVPFPFLT